MTIDHYLIQHDNDLFELLKEIVKNKHNIDIISISMQSDRNVPVSSRKIAISSYFLGSINDKRVCVCLFQFSEYNLNLFDVCLNIFYFSSTIFAH